MTPTLPRQTDTKKETKTHTFAHSRAVVNDKGGNIFIISHLESF
jgi:hypothetical protein